MTSRGRWRGFGWSAASMLTTRVSTLIAVPLVLHGVGTDLYAAWVLAGTVVMAQGLVDFGAAAATVRFVAVGATAGSRTVVTGTLLVTSLFYVVLSAVVAVALLVFGDQLAGLVPALDGEPAVDPLLVYTAIAFALTNAVMILAAALQGLDRVDASFRGQTLGWLVYVPVLAGGLALDWGIHAVGLAWVAGYGLQSALLAADTVRAIRRVPHGPGRAPSVRELFGLGARWQVSSWADFATFQVPRLLGGVVLSSAGLVVLDIALRGAQLVVAPFFAAYPLVLPAAASAWARERERGLAVRLERWAPSFTVALVLVTALAIPLLPPLLTVWTGVTLDRTAWAVTALITLGTVAHAASGPLTSALLAAGRIDLEVSYKLRQLIVAAVLLAAVGRLGLLAIALGLAAALTAPAALFVQRAGRTLGMHPPPLPWGRLGLAAAACLLLPLAAVVAASAAPTAVRLSIGVAVAAVVLPPALALLGGRRLLPSGPQAVRH